MYIKGDGFYSKILQKQIYAVVLAAIIFLAVLAAAVPGDSAYWLRYWWMFPIAFLIALTVNTAGISGAALFVPFFILIFPFLAGTNLQAIETVKLGLITESFGLSSSALAFLAFGLVDIRIALRSILVALPFVFGGAFLTALIPESVLFFIIAVLLVVSVFLLWFEKELEAKRRAERDAISALEEDERGEAVVQKSKDGKEYRYAYTRAGQLKRFAGYALGGSFQGATGFGIGEMGIIATMLSHIPTRIAIGTSHLIVATTAIAASLVHFFFASNAAAAAAAFPWNIPAMTIPAVIAGGQLAPYVAAKLPTRYLERFVSGLFIIIAGALIVLAFSK